MQPQEATTMAADDDASPQDIAAQLDADPSLVGVTAAENRQTNERGADARREVEAAAAHVYQNQSIYADDAESEYDAIHCECGWAASNQGADYSRQALERLAQTHAAKCGGPVAVLEVNDGEYRERESVTGGDAR
jgi:hypothetical protein